MQDTYIDEGVLIAVVIGITQIVKPFISDRYSAVVPVVLAAIMSAITAYLAGGNIAGAVLKGIVLGLTSAGLYDNGKILKK